MTYEERLVLQHPVTNTGPEVVQVLAHWLGVEQVWLAHVIESNGTCGCAFDQEMGNYLCSYWQAVEDKQKADRRLAFEQQARDLRAHPDVELTPVQLAQAQGIDPSLLP